MQPQQPSQVWAARHALTLGTHLSVRAWTATSPMGAARTPLLRCLAVAFAAVDVLEARWLRGHAKPAFGPRAVLAAVDAATWAAAEDERSEAYTAAMLPGVGLAVESGYRGGAPVVAVPVAVWAGAAAGRLLARKPVYGSELLWQALAVAAGRALRVYEQRRVQASRRQEDQRHEADVNATALEAEAEIYDRSPAADALHGAAVRLVPYLPRDCADELRDSRIDQAVKARRTNAAAEPTARYLKDVLVEACLREVERTPDVRAWRLPKPASTADGMYVLTAAQGEWLLNWLSDVGACGELAVRVPRQSPASRAREGLRLEVGDQTVVVPVDRPSRLRLDLVPVGMAVGGAMALTGVIPNQARIPGSVCASAAAVSAGSAVLAHRAAGEQDAGKLSAAVLLNAASPLLLCTIGQRRMRRTHVNGVSRYSGTTSLAAFWLCASHSWRDLTGLARTGAVGASLLGLGASYVLAVPPRNGRHFLAELVWPVAHIAVTLRLKQAVAREVEVQAQHLREDHAVLRAAALDRVWDEALRELDRSLRRNHERRALVQAPVGREAEVVAVADAMLATAADAMHELRRSRRDR